jgi:hypothetical protein
VSREGEAMKAIYTILGVIGWMVLFSSPFWLAFLNEWYEDRLIEKRKEAERAQQQ